MPQYTLRVFKITAEGSIGRQLKATVSSATDSTSFGFKGTTRRHHTIAEEIYFGGTVDVLIRVEVSEVDAKKSDKPYSASGTIKVDSSIATFPIGTVVVPVAEIGGRGRNKGKTANLTFHFEAPIDNRFTVREIPEIMAANQWTNGAALMNRWFSAPAGRQLEETATIKMDWVLQYDRAKKVYDSILSEKIYANANAREKIKNKYGKTMGKFDDFGRPVPELDKGHIQHRLCKSNILLDSVDDLFCTLGNFGFCVVVKGEGTADSIIITHIGIYAKDDYSFEGFQPLGVWSKKTNYGGSDPSKGVTVFNSAFRDYRKRTKKGGDFWIYSEIKVIPLKDPVVIRK